MKVRPHSVKNLGVLRAETVRTSRQSSLTPRSGRSNSRTREVESFGGFTGFRVCQEYREFQEGRQQCLPKEPHWQRQRSWSRQQQRTRQQQGQDTGVKNRHRPQGQPKSKLTSGGNRHRPRRRSFWLSDTEIEPEAQLVDAGQEATAESCAHRQCQRRRHPRLRTEFCWEVAQIHSCGQAPACLRTNRSLAITRFGTRKRLIGSVAIDGYDSSTPTKTLAMLWSSHSGLKIMFSFWLSKMTGHISEAEASQKIITGAQTLEIITERAIELSVVEEKQRNFLSASSRSTTAPSFRIFAKIHTQPISSRPVGNYRNFCLGTAFFFVLSSYLHWFACSHHWLG